MPHLNANGIRIYYEIHGKGDPLVLIMGLRRNVEWWYCQIPLLSKHFKVIAFDNRGAGRSDKPKMDYSIRLFADDTAALMEALKIKKANVLSISMGGYIAQELAINYPDKIRSLILGCTSCGGERAVVMSQERKKKFEAVEGLTPEEILKNNMDIYFSDEFIQGHPENIEEFIFETNNASICFLFIFDCSIASVADSIASWRISLSQSSPDFVIPRPAIVIGFID